MRKLRLFGLALVIAFLVSSCSKDESENVQPFLGYEYFPLRVGSEIIYDCDSIAWLGFTFTANPYFIQIDTLHFQVREVVESFFTDNQGRETARIVRYKRNAATDPWVIYKVYSANLTSTTAERFEDNTRFVKLVFPAKENVSWNGNSQNNLDEREYEYEVTNEEGSVGLLTFDSTLTVNQYEDLNAIEFNYFKERYATGVGMIEKENIFQEYYAFGIIKNGYIYTEKIISYSP